MDPTRSSDARATLDMEAIVREILAEYALPPRGHHGVVHWARVLENGLRIAERTGASTRVVTLFALFHDSRRENEAVDPGHGARGGELALAARSRWYDASDAEVELLVEACRLHTDGRLDGDVTLQTCWDADRLDLGRVGITPRPDRLCTDAGRSLLHWANARAITGHVPALVSEVWKL
jgi:uncharacterized protein